MSPADRDALERQMAALLLREQTAKTEKAEAEARVARIIEDVAREQRKVLSLPKLPIGGAA